MESKVMSPIPTWLALAALLMLGCAGCMSYHGQTDYCEGVTCSGHGECRLNQGQPACACDPGWEPDPADALVCVMQEDEPIIVDSVTVVAQPAGGYIVVSLRDHADVHLDDDQALTSAHLAILETSQEYQKPVYLEIDPHTRVIQEVLVPYDSPVHSLVNHPEVVEVQLVYSAAIHFLDRSHPDFDQMHADLQASVEDGQNLLVTETRDDYFIIDVRPPMDP